MKDRKDVKSELVAFKLTPHQRERLELFAKMRASSVSQFLRQAVDETIANHAARLANDLKK